MAITVLPSTSERFLLLLELRCRVGGCGYALGVEFVGFHKDLAVPGRRGLDITLLLPVPARLRKGVEKSEFPLPIRAFRRLQRDGLVICTCGSSEAEDTGRGDGYGGCTLGDGILGLALSALELEIMVGASARAVEGPACNAVGALP